MLTLTPWQHSAAPAGAMKATYPRTAPDGRDGWAIWWPGERHDVCALYLHGHGSGGDQPYVRQDIRGLWVPELRKLGLGILSPHLGPTHWLAPWAAEELRSLIAAARDELGVRRFLIISGSMGGASALAYSVLHPEDIAAAVALCPVTDVGGFYRWCGTQTDPFLTDEARRAIEESYGGTPDTLPDVFAARSAVAHADRLTMPLLVIHAAGDAVVPVDESRRLVAAFRGRRNLTYIEMPGGHHDSPLSHPAIWPWLAGQVWR